MTVLIHAAKYSVFMVKHTFYLHTALIYADILPTTAAKRQEWPNLSAVW